MKKIPIPSNINWIWNIGFILSTIIIIQTISGIIISINYINNSFTFKKNIIIYYNNNWGWIIRTIHINIPSIIFISIIIHIKRNIYFNSFKNKKIWYSGIILIIIIIITSFIGYILPWRQISYWGIIVITNIISIIPYIGKNIIITIWGNFNINDTSLNRIFILHFIFPIIIIIIIIIHINILHKNYSFNQLGTRNKTDIISFNSYFIIKDIIIINIIILLSINIIINFPIILNNNDNFIKISPINTPSSIEPEWYFILFYSILRLIENKIGGLIISIISIIIIIILPYINTNKFQSSKFYINKKFLLWLTINLILIISLIGYKPINQLYIKINKKLITIFFLTFPIIQISRKITDKII